MKELLVRASHIPQKAMFPVIDGHNHIWGDWESVGRIVETMGEVGVVSYCDLTSNLALKWADGGYDFSPGNIDDFFIHCTNPYPAKFYGFTCATFNRPRNEPLFSDAERFVQETVELLNDHIRRGARGLKILKELGLFYRDDQGMLVFMDDEQLAPLWEEAGRLGIPVLVHQSDPCGFFDPVMSENEHYETLRKYPAWSYVDSKFPRKEELLERRDRVLKNHPDTTFMLPHVANFAENLEYVSKLLDDHPNVFIDFSARMDELGRHPYSARDFLVAYQDRVYFGTDMPPSAEMYGCYFRFLETFDEYFIPPDYDGTFGRFRWRIHGLGLPAEVLEKIYYRNILRIVPGLKNDLQNVISSSQRREEATS